MEKLKIQELYLKHEDSIAQMISNFEIEGENVVDGERNAIKKFKLGETEVNIKRFKNPNVFNAFIYKYFRKSKAKRSYEYANILISKDIKTPIPVAFYERTSLFCLKDSYYMSKHINYDFDFRNLIHNPQFPNRESILRQFTDFTFKLHENNIEFLDHSPGNTLIMDNKNGSYDFYLIDLNRMRFKSMNFNQRLQNFRRLWLSKTMVKIIAQRYSELYSESFDKVHDHLLMSSRKFQKTKNSKKLRRLGRRPKFKV